MSNMSYCRFQNTNSDLSDCEEALNDGDKLSSDEEDAAVRLIQKCTRIAEQFEDCFGEKDKILAQLRNNYMEED